MKQIFTDSFPMKSPVLILLSLFVFFSISAREYFQQYRLSFEKDVNHLELISNLPAAKFSKAELGISVPESITVLVEEFLKTGKGINPFDPDQVDIRVVFEHDSGKYTVNAFYFDEYSRDASTIKPVFLHCPDAKWNKNATDFHWRVRFAPPYAGKWTATALINAPSVSEKAFGSSTLVFEVIQGKADGFLEVGSDQRHFRFGGSNKSFFMLGQDIAWPDGNRFRGGTYPAYTPLVAGGFLDIQDWTRNLAANGGNTIRVVNVPWSYELEWDNIGVYRMDRAWELDQLFSVCEEVGVKMMFCMEHGTYTDLPGDENLDWNKHPYHRALKNIVMPEDFLTDSTARATYKKKLRYFLARWGYSQSLGVFQLISEMEHWTLRGKQTNLKDNKSAQRKFLDWHNVMLSYAKEQVTYRSLLTSTSYGAAPRDHAINAFSSGYVDVVCPRHCYYTQRNDNVDRFNEVNNDGLFEKGIHGMFPNKPALFDELGFGTSVADPNDIDGCNDVTYHNTIWATSFSGTAGAGFYWWRWGNNEYRKQNFPALAKFYADVDFVKYNFVLPGHWEDASRAANVSIETFYITTNDRSRSRCIGWVHNASYWWGNISQACKDRNGKLTAIRPYTNDDENISSPQELKQGTRFEVHDLAKNVEYTIHWYSTRQAGGEMSTGTVQTNVFGTAKILWAGGVGDWAYKLERR